MMQTVRFQLKLENAKGGEREGNIIRKCLSGSKTEFSLVSCSQMDNENACKDLFSLGSW